MCSFCFTFPVSCFTAEETRVGVAKRKQRKKRVGEEYMKRWQISSRAGAGNEEEVVLFLIMQGNAMQTCRLLFLFTGSRNTRGTLLYSPSFSALLLLLKMYGPRRSRQTRWNRELGVNTSLG